MKMRRFMQKFLCALIVMMLLGYNISINAENDTEDNTAEDSSKKTQLQKLQESNKELQEQIEQSMSELTLVQDELTQNLVQVQELDEKIKETENELDKLNEQIDELTSKIKNVEIKVKKKREEYNTQLDLLDERLLAIYEGGEIQYLDILLGSSNVTEFLSRYFMIVELFEYDKNLLEEVNDAKVELETEEKQLKTEKTDLSDKVRLQQKKSQVLENTKTARELYLSKLSEEEQNIQNQIDEYKTQVAQIESEIKKLSVVASFGEDYVGEDMIWPVPGYKTITSRFGMRVHPITGLYRLHTGTDVGAPTGTNFLAMATGIVVKAERNYAYGNMVILDHGGGVQTLYAHGSEILVEVGETVNQGQPVLKVGSTGYSTGPHAHFEVRIDGTPVNPLDYVEPE